ncbi:MAG: tetratricopeptide repeat protein [Anaerolineae bacterium]|nr:tetratricopeptide repeat protein [Anaerolineae bacterium]
MLWFEGKCDEANEAWRTSLQLDDERILSAFGLVWANEVPPVVLREPLSVYALNNGILAREHGAPESATEWFLRSLSLSVSRKAIEGHLNTAGAVKHEEERALWQQLALETPPVDPDHWWAVARLAALDQDWERAAELYEQGARIAPSPYQFWYASGTMWERSEAWESAKYAFEQALAAQPEVVWPYVALGNLERRKNEFDTALGWYQQALSVNPTVFEPYYYIGLIRYYQELDSEAMTYLTQATALNSGHAWSFYFIAKIQFRNRAPLAAIETLEHALELTSQPPWEWFLLLGDWQLEMDDRERALQSYENALLWDAPVDEVNHRIERLEDEN